MVAFLGITLHKALALPIEKGSAVQHTPLRSRKLSQLRNRFRGLKLFVIDEFSFLSYEVLRTAHCRLQEIYDNSEFFGGVNVFLVGKLEGTHRKIRSQLMLLCS